MFTSSSPFSSFSSTFPSHISQFSSHFLSSPCSITTREVDRSLPRAHVHTHTYTHMHTNTVVIVPLKPNGPLSLPLSICNQQYFGINPHGEQNERKFYNNCILSLFSHSQASASIVWGYFTKMSGKKLHASSVWVWRVLLLVQLKHLNSIDWSVLNVTGSSPASSSSSLSMSFGSQSSQPAIDDVFNDMSSIASGDKKVNITKRITIIIAEDCMPIDTVNGDRLRCFMKYIRSVYVRIQDSGKSQINSGHPEKTLILFILVWTFLPSPLKFQNNL